MRTPLQELNELELRVAREKCHDIPYIYRKPNKVNNANSLTKAVIKFLTLSGHQAERVSVEGRVIDKRQTYTDVLGHTKTVGTFKRIPSSATRGSADISATIKRNGVGMSVKIEIKYGRDVQSDVQKRYQEQIERAGGQYWLVRTFDSFMEQYKKFMSETD